MPKIRLTHDQVGELVDTLTGEIADLRKKLLSVEKNGPADVEMRHRESVLMEILEVLEDV